MLWVLALLLLLQVCGAATATVTTAMILIIMTMTTVASFVCRYHHLPCPRPRQVPEQQQRRRQRHGEDFRSLWSNSDRKDGNSDNVVCTILYKIALIFYSSAILHTCYMPIASYYYIYFVDAQVSTLSHSSPSRTLM